MSALKSGQALVAIMEHAQRERNRQFSAYIDALSAGVPQKRASLWTRLSWRVEDWRERLADGIRSVADRVDPYA